MLHMTGMHLFQQTLRLRVLEFVCAMHTTYQHADCFNTGRWHVRMGGHSSCDQHMWPCCFVLTRQKNHALYALASYYSSFLIAHTEQDALSDSEELHRYAFTSVLVQWIILHHARAHNNINVICKRCWNEQVATLQDAAHFSPEQCMFIIMRVTEFNAQSSFLFSSHPHALPPRIQ